MLPCMVSGTLRAAARIQLCTTARFSLQDAQHQTLPPAASVIFPTQRKPGVLISFSRASIAHILLRKNGTNRTACEQF